MDFSSFVECEIYAVSVATRDGCDDVLIEIVDHEQKRHLLTAVGVSDFILHEMRLQNIIDRIVVFSGENFESNLVQNKIFFLVRGRYAETEGELEVVEVKAFLDDIRSSQKLMLEIQPVYGAYVLLIADKIALSLL